jgi:hypothetical protein
MRDFLSALGCWRLKSDSPWTQQDRKNHFLKNFSPF